MSYFEDLLEIATSPVQISLPDEKIVNELCDLIWELKVDPELSLQAIHTKIADENPMVAYFGLLVLEKAFYKCGSFIHGPICTPSYMASLKKIILSTKHERIKRKIFEMLLDWSDKFEHLDRFNKPIQNLLSQLSDNMVDYESSCIEKSEAQQNVYSSFNDTKSVTTKECSVSIVKCDLKVSRV